MWLACNFSLQHLYITQQTGNENTQTYQVRNCYLDLTPNLEN